MAVERIDHNVEFAVVEEVADGHASAYIERGQRGAFDRRLNFKLFAIDVVEEQGTLFPGGSPGGVIDLGIDMAVCDDEVFPAVVVKVEESVAPAEEGDGGLGDAHLIADVGEVGIAV